MDNQTHTRFISDWIREQEKSRIQTEQEKRARNRQDQRQSTKKYNTEYKRHLKKESGGLL
jgi:hypothetical protein